MPIKIIIDLSDSTKDEIDKYLAETMNCSIKEILVNHKEYNVAFQQIFDYRHKLNVYRQIKNDVERFDLENEEIKKESGLN